MNDELFEIIDPAHLDPLADTMDGALLKHAALDGEPSRPRRIFVNRNLRMSSVRYVGFDLDWTLADYHRKAMDWLAFELTRDRLIEQFHYPDVVRSIRLRHDFPRRGLIVDRDNGVVLKMNRHRYVGRAYFGRKRLDGEERKTLYRTKPINPSHKRFYHVDTLFEIPEVAIFSEIIELHRNDPDAMPIESWDKVFTDVRAAIDSIHADGSIKSRIIADMDRYVPPSPDVALALRRLAMDGRKLMLITNSEWYYTKALCSHLFDNCLPGLGSWRELFDLVIVSSKKPRFFREELPFFPIDPETDEEAEGVEVPEWGGIYRGGCRSGLMKLLGEPGEQVLYIGDHIYGDVVATKMGSTWRTALIVRELEEELRARIEQRAVIERLRGIKAELSALGTRMDDARDVLELYKRLAEAGRDVPAEDAEAVQNLLDRLENEHRALRHRATALQERISASMNPTWGGLFRQGGSKSLFGSQVCDFACLYTSRVANFAHYGSQHYYRVLTDPMPHETGV